MSARKVIPLLVALAVVGGGIAIVGSSMSSGVFSLTIEEALASAGRLRDKDFKVGGNVVAGSVGRGATPFELSFAIADAGGRRLDCHYKGSVPDPFAEGREVILQGRMDDGSRMEVSKITVKCPSKYQEEGVNEEQYDDYYRKKYDKGHRKE
jgi:cytochrome c-type biogenesis protein CcmE